ncbi:MAG TPA: hypothetical protein DEA08_10805 [Planctomycetes bacterium]|nr:hypothetical protein [Planctomycetota bacterium]
MSEAARKVVVGSDGSALAEGVLDPLQTLLGSEEGARVYLLRTIAADAPEEQIEEARAALEQAARRHAAPRCEFEAHVRRGDAAEEILRFSQEVEADLIAMSSHGRRGVERFVRGSVAERVLRHAERPVLLLNPFALASWEGGVARVIVPLDGSERAEAILPLAQDFARRLSAELRVLHVSEPNDAPHRGIHRARIEATHAGLDAEGQPATLALREGGPAEAILDEVEQSEGGVLLAMTTHGLSGLERWAYGSVAEHVLRRCPAPLLVLRQR